MPKENKIQDGRRFKTSLQTDYKGPRENEGLMIQEESNQWNKIWSR